MGETDVLALRGMQRAYGGKVAVRGVSLTVPAGAIYVLCGANGSGKTTTLSVLAGLIFADGGTLAVGGTDVALDRYVPRPGLGFVPETPLVDDDLTAWQWLAFVAGVKGVAVPADAAALADRLTLDADTLGQPARSLSFGTRRKVAIWAEMLTCARVLLLDEPLIGLDPLAIEGFHRCARAFVSGGRSIVLSTHLLREAEALATHVGVLHRGALVREGTLDDVRGDGTLHGAFLELAGG